MSFPPPAGMERCTLPNRAACAGLNPEFVVAPSRLFECNADIRRCVPPFPHAAPCGDLDCVHKACAAHAARHRGCRTRPRARPSLFGLAEWSDCLSRMSDEELAEAERKLRVFGGVAEGDELAALAARIQAINGERARRRAREGARDTMDDRQRSR